MRGLRSHRSASYLALAALALQFVLSFAHVHLDGIRAASPAFGLTSPTQAQSSPVQQPGTGTDDDYCAICASIYLAANSFLPQAPVLPLPWIASRAEHLPHIAALFVTSRRAPFQSRAPPHA
jgi:hypothetical protein